MSLDKIRKKKKKGKRCIKKKSRSPLVEARGFESYRFLPWSLLLEDARNFLAPELQPAGRSQVHRLEMSRNRMH